MEWDLVTDEWLEVHVHLFCADPSAYHACSKCSLKPLHCFCVFNDIHIIIIKVEIVLLSTFFETWRD